jgi:metal-sulfur cluster biosynthetic enzyme
MAQSELEHAILEKLSTVIDPETGTDVIRMRLVQNLSVDENGKAAFTFRPSSPLCPLAVTLALAITDAVRGVPGVTGQDINVVDYIQADMLNKVLKNL